MEAKLVVVGGDSAAHQYDLHLPTVIGRSRSTDLMLGDPLVSRRHCEVFEVNGMMMVRDLGSLNGTWVGENRISEKAVPVKSGDLITIGPVTFRALYYAESGEHENSATWEGHRPTMHDPFPSFLDDIEETPPMSKADSDDLAQSS